MVFGEDSCDIGLKKDVPAVWSGSERTLKIERVSSSGTRHCEVDGRRLFEPEKRRFLPDVVIPLALPLLCSVTGEAEGVDDCAP